MVKRLDRAELEKHYLSRCLSQAALEADSNSWPQVAAQALASLLLVLDAAVALERCPFCNRPWEYQHEPDCPVKACVDAGLAK